MVHPQRILDYKHSSSMKERKAHAGIYMQYSGGKELIISNIDRKWKFVSCIPLLESKAGLRKQNQFSWNDFLMLKKYMGGTAFLPQDYYSSLVMYTAICRNTPKASELKLIHSNRIGTLLHSKDAHKGCSQSVSMKSKFIGLPQLSDFSSWY